MALNAEPFSPWHEAPAALSARHVGRARELDALTSGAAAFARGRAPLPMYLFGEPGSGKSHLLALMFARLSPPLREW